MKRIYTHKQLNINISKPFRKDYFHNNLKARYEMKSKTRKIFDIDILLYGSNHKDFMWYDDTP